MLSIAGLSGRRTPHAGESAPGYIFALSTVGLAVVLYLAYASFFILKAVCLLCIVTYVSLVALFVMSGARTTFPVMSLFGRMPGDLRAFAASRTSLLVAALLAVGTIGAIAAFPAEQPGVAAATQAAALVPLTDRQRADLEQWWDVQPKFDVPVPANGAKVLMVKFSDFQCPGCGATYTAYAPLIEKWTRTGQFRFVLKHYPLEPECNGSVSSIIHPASCEAAAAVEMARAKDDGSADRLEHWFFTHQTPMLSVDEVRQAAKDVGGIEDFASGYAGALATVRTDAAQGAALGVSTTPTFFINGRRLVAGQDPRVIDGVIDLEMKRAK